MRIGPVLLLALHLCAATSLRAADFWRPLGGPGGGEIFALTCDSNGRLFASTYAAGGVYRSLDRGASWERKATHLENDRVVALAAGAAGTVLAGTGHGVFRSLDGGETWQQGLPQQYPVRALALHPNGSVFAGGAGVWRSTDNGETWTRADSGLTSTSVEGLAVTPAGVLFAVTWDGIFRSFDDGHSWSKLGYLFAWSVAIDALGHVVVGGSIGVSHSADGGATWTHSYLGRTAFAVAACPDGEIFAGTDSGLFRSSDDGATWIPVNDGVTNRYILALAVGPDHEIYAGTLGAGVFRSSNHGDSWESASRGLENIPVSSLVAAAGGGLIAGSSEGGVFRSDSLNGDWRPASGGITSGGIYALARCEHGTLVAGGAGPDALLRSTDGAQNWQVANEGLGYRSVLCLAVSPDGMFYAGTPASPWYWGGGVYRSKDDAATWTDTHLVNADVYSLAVSPKGNVFAGSWPGVYRSDEAGANWRLLPGMPQAAVISLAFDADGGLFAGTETEVLRSLDDGETWTRTALAGAGEIFSLVVNAQDVLFAGTRAGVYRTVDRGDHWEALLEGLADREVSCLALDPRGFLYAGTAGGGVFASLGPTIPVLLQDFEASQQGRDAVLRWRTSDDEGVDAYRVERARWGGAFEPLQPQVPRQPEHVYEFRDPAPQPGRYEYRVVAVRAAGDVVLGHTSLEITATPSQESLLEIPNPFAPGTSFRYGLARAGRVTLHIFDVRGRCVRALVAEPRADAGIFAVRWDGRDDRGRDVGSGVYWFRLAAPGRVLSRSATLVR